MSRSDGKRPDGATLVPRSRGKSLAWVVTVPDTYAASHIQATAIFAGAAAEKASDNKMVKYNDLATTHIFVPIAVETSGAWCSQSAQFIEDLGRRITAVTNELLETTYLYQRLSVSLQRGNAVAFNNTFPETEFFPQQWPILFGKKISNLTIFMPACFVLAGEKKKKIIIRRRIRIIIIILLFIQELGKRITVCTKDPKETQYLFQQLSMAIQRGNAVSFLNTFSTD